jgi:hypothetical protein
MRAKPIPKRYPATTCITEWYPRYTRAHDIINDAIPRMSISIANMFDVTSLSANPSLLPLQATTLFFARYERKVMAKQNAIN